jgi:hypothetical protein
MVIEGVSVTQRSTQRPQPVQAPVFTDGAKTAWMLSPSSGLYSMEIAWSMSGQAR